MKRLFDIIISLIALAVGLPFGLLIALVIVMDTKGKIFYKQTRVGRNNVDFQLYKFRTMYSDSDRGSLITIGEKDAQPFCRSRRSITLSSGIFAP